MHLAFFGHHKCASTSVGHLCFDLANHLGLPVVYRKTAFEYDIGDEMNKYSNSFLISLNSSVEGLASLPNLRGFHLIRDPRDICISGYFSHLYSHGLEGFDRLHDHRKALKSCDIDQGLFLEFEFSKLWLDHIYHWDYAREDILELKMEEMFSDARRSWLQILNFMGIEVVESIPLEIFRSKANHVGKKLGYYQLFDKKKISERQLQSMVDAYSFKNLSQGRSKGKEDHQSHYRKGSAGDWKNYFKEEHKAQFKKLYGPLLIKLGYEKDQNW